MDAEASGVAQQLAEGDAVGGEFRVTRELPRTQEAVDVLIEAELALLDEAQRDDGGGDLADRCGLERGVGGDGGAARGVADAPAAGPGELAAVDDRDADPGLRPAYAAFRAAALLFAPAFAGTSPSA